MATWKGDGNGMTGTHTLPEGKDGLYPETAEGKNFKVYDKNVKWLDGSSTRKLPQNVPGEDRFEARYVRVYMNGCFKDNNLPPFSWHPVLQFWDRRFQNTFFPPPKACDRNVEIAAASFL